MFTMIKAGAGGITSIDFVTETYSVVDAALTTYLQPTTQAKIVAITNASGVQGYRWQGKDGAWKTFDANGKLVATGERNLTLTRLVYDGAGILTGVNDGAGRTLFTVTSNGSQITAVRDRAGREVHYAYSGAMMLLTVV